MVTEDYVSFETAKLLKEKGFRAVTNRYYNAQFNQVRTVSDVFAMDWNDEEHMRSITMPGAVTIPTLQMAMKWLREIHNINPLILTGDNNNKENPVYYWFRIDQIVDNKLVYGVYRNNEKEFGTYEEACEAGIRYCLENLI